MDTIGAVLYFGTVFGALPMFVVLDAVAIARLGGWTRILSLVLAAYMAWTVFQEFGPVLVHARELEPNDFRRLLYERWSAVSSPALIASAVALALLGWRALKPLPRRPG